MVKSKKVLNHCTLMCRRGLNRGGEGRDVIGLVGVRKGRREFGKENM